MKRRSFIAMAASAIPAIKSSAYASSVERPFTISAYGGLFEKAFQQHVANIFTRETNIPIKVVSQSGDDAWVFGLVNAIKNGLAPVDLTILKEVDLLRIKRMGDLLTDLDVTQLNNLGSLPSQYHFESSGALQAVGFIGWYINLTSNVNKLNGPPVDSWVEAFENPDLKNVLALAGFYNGGVVEVVSEVYFEGESTLMSPAGQRAVFDKIRSFKPRVKLWWTGESQMEQGLRSGNVVTGMYPHDVALLLREEGFPVESKFPKECAFMNVGYYACPANSPFSDLAARFIDFSLRPDIQRTFAEKMKLSPLIGRENSALDVRDFNLVATEGPIVRPASRAMVENASALQRMWQRTLSS